MKLNRIDDFFMDLLELFVWVNFSVFKTYLMHFLVCGSVDKIAKIVLFDCFYAYFVSYSKNSVKDIW